MKSSRAPSFEITEYAARSIVDQTDYYRRESIGTGLDERWQAAVTQSILSLENLPLRGTPCRFSNRSLQNLRWIPIDGFASHILIYRYMTSSQTILIVDVVHGARDLEALTNGWTR